VRTRGADRPARQERSRLGDPTQDQRPGNQVEVILRDHDLTLLPHVVVRLEQIRTDGTAPAPGRGLPTARGW
jgi:hypothetical protein